MFATLGHTVDLPVCARHMMRCFTHQYWYTHPKIEDPVSNANPGCPRSVTTMYHTNGLHTPPLSDQTEIHTNIPIQRREQEPTLDVKPPRKRVWEGRELVTLCAEHAQLRGERLGELCQEVVPSRELLQSGRERRQAREIVVFDVEHTQREVFDIIKGSELVLQCIQLLHPHARTDVEAVERVCRDVELFKLHTPRQVQRCEHIF